ncbi:ATP-binding cassette domain-containing protein [Cognatilysobacter lacus]|uniref:ATP-binding cassette domain-containing protein n=1 Tax=Cognatilysobacter lacus TaxID=1643323 RepID=A0A5D8Z9K1_9GAMM|nr:ATP-binding cassette domain-containing protein [Lysobacter lacus]TZF91337.1 ATP-binding cassette domain-containing protein [Lysobacter lacus]
MSDVVHSIDVTLRRGSFERRLRIESDARVLALVGASGSGKTSVLHAVAGLLRPARGHIAIAGETLFDAARGVDVAPHRRRIGYVFQDGRLFPHLDVRRNLLYGARSNAGGFTLDDVAALLALGPLMQRRITGLSGGEVQRIALGRALLSQPRLLLLDEPLSMLDPDRREELLPYLQGVRDESGLPMIYVSHAADEVARIAQDVHRFDD